MGLVINNIVFCFFFFSIKLYFSLFDLFFSFPPSLTHLGDFGNENVEIVQSVAELEFPKAVILGNHDSWKTQEFSGK